MEIHNWTQTGKGTYARAILQKNDLLKLNRDQSRWVVELFTGYCYLKGHLFNLGLTDDPICKSCLEEDESAIHNLCNYEAKAYLIPWCRQTSVGTLTENVFLTCRQHPKYY
jgi:hypothetical protein